MNKENYIEIINEIIIMIQKQIIKRKNIIIK